MNGLLLSSIVTITLALVFYTIGVWREHRENSLKKIHLLFFGLGLVFDSTGTYLMAQMAEKNESLNMLTFYLHRFTCGLAILLMMIHLIWAIYVLVKGSDEAREKFHRLSVVVWGFWLVPYLVGMIIGMRG